MNNFFVLGLLTSVLAVAYSLDFNDYQEGSCGQYKPQANFNATWLANTNLPYLSAGSRYNLYRIAAGHPQFASMRDHEFHYEACLQAYLNVTTGVGLAYGFGAGVVGNFDVRYTEKKGVYDFLALPTPGLNDVAKHYATLTDNKSFVFWSICSEGSNQRGWVLLSLTPTLDTKTQQLIEDHAKSLGFDRRQFVFLRYDSCSADSPVPGSFSGMPTTKGKKTSVATFYEQKMMRMRLNRNSRS